MPTILFFLGHPDGRGARCETGGVLTDMADWLRQDMCTKCLTIAGAIGILSSVVDNVPLVAACMGMYPGGRRRNGWRRAPTRLSHRVFVAGRAVLAPADLLRRRGRQSADHRLGGRRRGDGTRKDQFRLVPQERISLLALSGYLAGIAVIWLEHVLIGL